MLRAPVPIVALHNIYCQIYFFWLKTPKERKKFKKEAFKAFKAVLTHGNLLCNVL